MMGMDNFPLAAARYILTIACRANLHFIPQLKRECIFHRANKCSDITNSNDVCAKQVPFSAKHLVVR